MGKIQVQNAWGSPMRDPQSIKWSVPQLPLLLVKIGRVGWCLEQIN